jgi:hypothetical protein
MNHSANLSDVEIDEICDGYTQNAAKVRFLRSLGLTVAQKPNGRPLVNRAHYDQVRGAGQLETAGSVEGPRWGVH